MASASLYARCKVNVGKMSHLSLFLNFSEKYRSNEVKVMLQHNEDMAVLKINLVFVCSHQPNLNLFTAPYEIHF